MKRGRPNMTRRNENFVSAVDFFNQLLRFYSEPEDQRENRIDQLIQLINENNDNASERVKGGIRNFIRHLKDDLNSDLNAHIQEFLIKFLISKQMMTTVTS